uniref:Uncharacterized protein n=1 Tax=Acrobeloides nanus TaxID=290746 RepID=A0A914E002_9BILA
MGWVGGGYLNEVIIYASNGTHNNTCLHGICQLNVSDSSVYILFDITYGLDNVTNIRAPIIFVQYNNWKPSYHLNNSLCQSNQNLRSADSKNFSPTINVTDCYCCAITSLWEQCPNEMYIPLGFTIDPVNTTVSLHSTTTVAISTSASTTHISPAPSTSTKAISTTTDRPPPVTSTNTTPTQTITSARTPTTGLANTTETSITTTTRVTKSTRTPTTKTNSVTKTTETPTTSDPSTLDCTNATDPFIIAFCNLNHNATAGDIANNITNLMNPSNLTGYNIFIISNIMINLTTRTDLNHSDFHNIARMIDVMLVASHNIFRQSNDDSKESTNIMLICIYFLMLHSPSNVTYLNGTNMGLASFEVDCTLSGGDTQLGDTGNQFFTLGSSSDTEAMISIPKSTICQNRASRKLFYGIYRNTKLFVGNSTHPVNAFMQNPPPPDGDLDNNYKNLNHHPEGQPLFDHKFWNKTRYGHQNYWYRSTKGLNHHGFTKTPDDNGQNPGYHHTGYMPPRGRNHHGIPNIFAGNGSNPNESVTDTPSACASGFWYGSNNKVMTATLLDQNSTDKHDQQFIEINGVRQTMIAKGNQFFGTLGTYRTQGIPDLWVSQTHVSSRAVKKLPKSRSSTAKVNFKKLF